MQESKVNDCLFCKFINKEIQTDIVYEDEHVLAFNDINPQAPVHQLIIPKLHVPTLNDLTDMGLAASLLTAVPKLAKQANLDSSGYRMVINCNSEGGQEVYHLHLHLIGGRQMIWPPG